MNPLSFILAAIGFAIGSLSRVEFAILSAFLGFLMGMVIDLKSKVTEIEKKLITRESKPHLPIKEKAEQKEKILKVSESTEKVQQKSEDLTIKPHKKRTEKPKRVPKPPPIPIHKKVGAQMEDSKYLKLIKDFFLKGNIVVRIGLVVLFFGIAFLLKYASDIGMFPLEARYIAATVGAIVLLVIGWRLRESHRNYGLLLQGGSIGMLYIIVFTSAKLFGLIPLSLAFALMVSLVFFSGVLAILQNARSTAWYGAAGGFLAPVLVSTGSGSHIALFSYYAILNCGILFIAFKKSWRELNLLGFYFTFGIATFWGARSYAPEFLISSELFLILFFLFFVLISVLFAFKQPPKLKGYVDGSLVFGLPIVTFSIQTFLFKDIKYGLAISALCLSMFYVIIAKILWKKQEKGMRTLTEAFLALGIVFVSLAIPLAVDGKWTAAAWAMEGAALIWVGIRQKRVIARCFGVILQVGSGLSFLVEFGEIPHSVISSYFPVINGFYLCCVIISITGFFSGFYLWKKRDLLKEWEKDFHLPLFIWGLFWWVASGLYEIYLYVDPDYIFNYGILFITLSILSFQQIYKKIQWNIMIWPVFSLLPILYIYTLFLAFHLVHPFSYDGFISFPVAFIVFYYTLYKMEENIPTEIRKYYHLGGLYLLIAVTTWELSWQIKDIFTLSQVWYQIVIGLVPGLFSFAIFSMGKKVKWPVQKHINNYQIMGTIIPLVFSLGWCLYSSIHLEGDPSPLPYLILFNPLEITQMFIFIVSFLWILKIKQLEVKLPEGITFGGLQLLICFFLFLAANSIIARTIHFYIDIPFEWDTLLSSMVYHSTLSIFWSILSLVIMVVATKKEKRKLWIVGISLLGIVVIKLFAVDFSTSQTGTKIITGIAVGVLMLVIGFFSPVPPKKKEDLS
ncbi:MAG: DUF2339 domain-containing protein [Desulfobacterales bacterium]|nr:DUF2339 domain-containing protein [Desulfobacterales bacterium]